MKGLLRVRAQDGQERALCYQVGMSLGVFSVHGLALNVGLSGGCHTTNVADHCYSRRHNPALTMPQGVHRVVNGDYVDDSMLQDGSSK